MVFVFNFRMSKWSYLSEKQLIGYWEYFTGLECDDDVEISDTDSLENPYFNTQENPVSSSDSEAAQKVEVISSAEEKRIEPDANLPSCSYQEPSAARKSIFVKNKNTGNKNITWKKISLELNDYIFTGIRKLLLI